MKRTGELINFIALKESKVSTRKLGASFPTIGSISLAAEAREVKGEIKISKIKKNKISYNCTKIEFFSNLTPNPCTYRPPYYDYVAVGYLKNMMEELNDIFCVFNYGLF